MIKSGFSYWKLAVVVAVLVITLIPSMRPSTAKSQTIKVAQVNLANEERVVAKYFVSGLRLGTKTQLASEKRALAKYFDDLVAYQNECAKLNQRAELVHIHINPVQLKADDLKSRLSAVQNAIRDIVKKLKAANEWDDLDNLIVISEARQKAFFQQTSFKRLLEESSNNLSSHGNEISAPLDNLRKRLTSRYGDGADLQIVRTGYEAPAPVGSPDSLGCTIGKIGLVLIHLSGGRPTDPAYDAVFHQCAPAGAVSPF